MRHVTQSPPPNRRSRSVTPPDDASSERQSPPANGSSSANGSNTRAPRFWPAVVERPVGSINAYAGNPRRHSAKQIRAIAASIEAFGLVMPLLVDREDTLIAGHAVFEAAKLLGMAEVPVVVAEHLSAAEVRALRLGLNRLAELSTWDEAALAVEFTSLIELDATFDLSFDIGITGFEPAVVDRIVTRAEAASRDAGAGLSPDDDVPEVPVGPAVSRLGDVWLLGEHRLACGDSTDPATFERLLGADRARMGIHDVPYNVKIKGNVSSSGRHGEFVMASGEMTETEFTAFLAKAFNAMAGASLPGTMHFAFIDWRHLAEMSAAGRAAGFELKNLCVWDKGTGAMGSLYRSQHELVFAWKQEGGPHVNNVELGKHGRNRTNVWSFPGASSLREELKLHATPKPVALVMEAIRDCSARGDIVLDAFSGSGTTIIAAARTGRRAAAVDLDPRFVDTGVLRWQRWSGGTAVHAETGATFEETKVQRLDEASAPRVRIRQRPANAKTAGDQGHG